jgi:hypothetical protein
MSRTQDPQLHTHVVCANMARGRDGRWTALDGTAIYDHAKAGGYIYQAHLRHAVRERLPWAEWGPVVNGMAELRQLPAEVLVEFSQRRRQILEREAELQAAGVEVGHKGRDRIAYDTREAKQDVDERDWREQIRVRAAEHGLGKAELDTLARLPAAAVSGRLSERELADTLFSPVGLTANQNSFHDRDVIAAVAQAAHQGAPTAGLLAMAERLLKHPEVVSIPASLDRRFTTLELLAAEHRVIDHAARGRNRGAGVLSDEHADAVLGQLEQTLSEAQEQTVRAIVGSGHRIDSVEALAGTGKTTSAGALRELYERAGWRVIGAAPTGRAVRELKERAGIDQSLTLDGWALKLAADPTALSFAEVTAAGARRQPAVMILDEAGLAHTRLSAQVIDAAMVANVKVIAIGDSGQLSSVQAGGWLGALTRRLGSHELRDVMRQRDPRERRLLGQVHRGGPAAYLKLKTDRGELRMFSGKTAGVDAEEAVIKAWASACERYGIEQAVIICRDNRRRQRLNELARAHLREDGRLGESVEIGRGQWALGDRVIARRNDRGRDLDNGMRATITSVDEERERLVVQVDAGGPRELDGQYVARHVEHAYALTGHGLQGGTIEWAAVIGQPEDFSRNWAYTALSRAREPVHIFLIAEPNRLQQEREELAPAQQAEAHADPVGLMTRRMRERDDEDLALEQLERAERDARELLTQGAEVAPPDGRVQLQTPESHTPVEPPVSPALVRLTELDKELARLHLELRDTPVEDARTIVRLNQTIAAVETEQRRDHRSRGLRDRGAHATRSRERREHLERLRGERDQLIDRTGDADAVLARTEQLRQRQRQLAIERRQVREQGIREELENQPAWLTNTLGYEPEDPRLREVWHRTAGELAGHRLDHHITDPNIVLGTDPHDQAIQRAIGDARCALGLDEPGSERDTGREF